MESGRVSGLSSRQDGTQFEDALRRLHALEKKLTDQVQVDIHELRQKWILPRVERVTNNTFKLYQVREQLKLSKVLFLEEERILEEFNKVKLGLKTSSMDDETFEATRETCMLLGGKLMDTRSKQLRCYADNEDLEMSINKDIMTLRFEDKDFEDLDIEKVRASTPLRQMSPTPLDRHRSREPSPFIMPKLRLGSGTITPGGSKPPDPHTYLSRPGSSQSLYGGAGTFGGSNMELDKFRAVMEAKQAEDESLPQTSRQMSNNPLSFSQSMCNISSKVGNAYQPKVEGSDLLGAGSMFTAERPSSAMSEMSINFHEGDYTSRAASRMEHFGDEVSNALILGQHHSDRGQQQDYLSAHDNESFGSLSPAPSFANAYSILTSSETNASEKTNKSQTTKQTIKITADLHIPSEKVMEQEKNVEVNKTISKKEDDQSHSSSVNSMSVEKETVSGTQEVYSSKDKTTIVGEIMDNKGKPDKETRKDRQGKEDRQEDKKEQKKNKLVSQQEDHDAFGDVPKPKETNKINQFEDTSSRSAKGKHEVEDKESLEQYKTGKQNETAKQKKDSKLSKPKEDETSQLEKDSEIKRKSTSKSNMKKSTSENDNKETNRTDDNKHEMPTKEYTKVKTSENYSKEENDEDQKDESSSRTLTASPIGTEGDFVIKEKPEKQSDGNQKKEIQTYLELKAKESKEDQKKENQTSVESNIKESKKNQTSVKSKIKESKENQTSVESTVKESEENKKKENQTSVESKVKGNKGKESENVNKYDEYGHKFLQNKMSPEPDSVKQQISDSHQQQQTTQKKMGMAHLDIDTEQIDKAIIQESEKYNVGKEEGQMDKTADRNLSIKTASENVNKYDEHGQNFLQNEKSTGPDSAKQKATDSKQQQQTTQKEMDMADVDSDTEQKNKAIIPESQKDDIRKEGGQIDKNVTQHSSFETIHNKNCFENKEVTQNECISPKENEPEIKSEGVAYKENQSPDSHQSKLPSKITTNEKINTIDKNQKDSVVPELCPQYEIDSPLQKQNNTGIDNKDEGNKEEVVQKDNTKLKADQKSVENIVIKNRLLEEPKEKKERNVPTKDSLKQANLEQDEPADITNRKREKDDLDQTSPSMMKVEKHSFSSKELLSDVSQNITLDKKLTNVEQEEGNIKKFTSTNSPKEARDEQLLDEGLINKQNKQSASKSINENKEDTQIVIEEDKKENEAEMTYENSDVYSIKDNCKEKSLSTPSNKNTTENLTKTLQKDIRDMENVINQEGGKQELKLKDMFENDVSLKDEESLKDCTKIGSSSTSKQKMSKKDKEKLEKIESPSANTNECNMADNDSMKKSIAANINNATNYTATADPESDNNASMNDNENNKESDVGNQDSFKSSIIRTEQQETEIPSTTSKKKSNKQLLLSERNLKSSVTPESKTVKQDANDTDENEDANKDKDSIKTIKPERKKKKNDSSVPKESGESIETLPDTNNDKVGKVLDRLDISSDSSLNQGPPKQNFNNVENTSQVEDSVANVKPKRKEKQIDELSSNETEQIKEKEYKYPIDPLNNKNKLDIMDDSTPIGTFDESNRHSVKKPSLSSTDDNKEMHNMSNASKTDVDDVKEQSNFDNLEDQTKLEHKISKNKINDQLVDVENTPNKDDTMYEKTNICGSENLAHDFDPELRETKRPRSRPASKQENEEKIGKQSKDLTEERPSSRSSQSGFLQTEPAEWYPQDENEDELMIILDTETVLEDEEPEYDPLGLIRPESRERSISRSSQGSDSHAYVGNENQDGNKIPAAITKNIEALRQMDLEIEKGIDIEDDSQAFQELELQYEKENGKDSRCSNLGRSSAMSNKVSTNRKDQGNEDMEAKHSRPPSRSSLKSPGKRSAFKEKKSISFEDSDDKYNIKKNNDASSEFLVTEPAEWIPAEQNDDELFIVLDSENKKISSIGKRSHSNERPGSRASESGDRKKSSSMVPELETVEIPQDLKKKFDDMEGDIQFLRESQEKFEKIKSDGNDRADSPRPPSQNRPSSTGFSHLDDFEKKLAAMEDELAVEEYKQQERDMVEAQERSLSRGENMWDLTMNKDLEDNKEMEREAIVDNYDRNTKHDLTEDGFYINKEEELDNVDHSMIKGGEFSNELEDIGSGYTSPGQSERKKVSFATSEERYEIERPGEVNTLGKNLFSFSPPKPMKKLPGKDGSSREEQRVSHELTSIEAPILVSKKRSSKEPSPMLSDNNSSLTGAGVDKSSSLFGSLLRKGRKGSRSASRQSSVERGSQDLGSEDEGRLSSRASDLGSDFGSQNSLVTKFKKLTKRKAPKVQTTDFDELFARGMARSAQFETENVDDQIGKDFTAFDLYKKDSNFEKSQKDEGIGYAEKVMSFLDDQAHTPQITKDITDERYESNKKVIKESEGRKARHSNKTNDPIENKNTSEPIQKEASPLMGRKSSSLKNLITGGRLASKSPDPDRKNSGSLFGSLLKLGRKGSRSGSRQSSVERSNQDLSCDDEARAISRASDIGSDAGSESSLVMKFKKLTKKKPPKVKSTDFDELFARGMARSAQFESESTSAVVKSSHPKSSTKSKSPTKQSVKQFATEKVESESTSEKLPTKQQFEQKSDSINRLPDISGLESDAQKSEKKRYATPSEIKLSPSRPKKDMFTGEDLPKSAEEEFLAKITQFVAKYEVDSEYTRKVWPAVPKPEREKSVTSRDSEPLSSKCNEPTASPLFKSPQEMFQKFTDKEDEQKQRSIRSKSRSVVRTSCEPENKFSRDKIENKTFGTINTNMKNEDTTKLISEPHNQDTSKATQSKMSEAEFLAKVTSFVAKYEPVDEYAQKVWPALPPAHKDREDKPTPKLSKTSGKTYLDIESGTEWFGRSIEMENTERDSKNATKKKSPKPANNLSAGADIMRKHISATESPKLSTSEMKQEPNEESRETQKLPLPGKLPAGKTEKLSDAYKESADESLPVQVSPGPTYKDKSPCKTDVKCNDKIPQPSQNPINETSDISSETLQPSLSKVDNLQLAPEKAGANQQFYSALVAGLRKITTPEPEHHKETTDTDIYRKYSHHLGRAEFGSLRKRDSAQSSISNLRYQSRDNVYNPASRGLSRDPSFDKINVKLTTSRRVSRQDSGENIRSQSKVSDTSEALPDLELDDDLPPVLTFDRRGKEPVSRTPSIREGAVSATSTHKEETAESPTEIKPSEDVYTRKEKAIEDAYDHKQKIKEVKERIQNGLMTVVGVGVMAYLTTLENMGGAP